MMPEQPQYPHLRLEQSSAPRRSVVRFVALLALNVPLAGCLQINEFREPERVLRAEAATGERVETFVFLRTTQSENIHWFSDPPRGDHWRDPVITHILLVEDGQVSFRAPPTVLYSSLGFFPMVGLVSGTLVGETLYAEGYEVHRHPFWGILSDTRELAGGVRETTYLFVKPRNQFLPFYSDPSSPETPLEATTREWLSRLRSQEPDSSKLTNWHDPDWAEAMEEIDRSAAYDFGGPEHVIADLQAGWLWSQLKERWNRGEDRRAIRYICDYYIDRLRRIKEVSPRFVLPQACQPAVDWINEVARQPEEQG